MPLPGPPGTNEEDQGLKVTYYKYDVTTPTPSIKNYPLYQDHELLGVYQDNNINFPDFSNTLDNRINDYKISDGIFAKWTGLIYLPRQGQYTFEVLTGADESVVVELSNLEEYLISSYAAVSHSKTIDIDESGWTRITVWWGNPNEEITPSAKMQLKWSWPGQPMDVIPQEYFIAQERSDEVIYIPKLENEPAQISYITAGVSMIKPNGVMGQTNITNNKLIVKMPEIEDSDNCPEEYPDCILKDDIWVFWSTRGNKEIDIKINDIDVQSDPSYITGTDLESSVGSYNIDPDVFDIPDPGEPWTLDISEMNSTGRQTNYRFLIYGKESDPDIKIDKFLITSENDYNPNIDGKGGNENYEDKEPGSRIWIEAESGQYGSMEEISDTDASGDVYISSGSPNNYRRYSFYVSGDNEYHFWVRVKSNGINDNSIKLKWKNSSATERDWTFNSTNDNWEWKEITGVEDFNVYLRKNEHNNAGLSIVIPYLDENVNAGRRLVIKNFNESVYKTVSYPLIFEMNQITQEEVDAGANKVDPLFFLTDGETRSTYDITDNIRPNYLYWAHGNDSEFPTNGSLNFTALAGGIGELITPENTHFNSSNKNSWFPAYGREGRHIDVLSTNYSQNLNDSESEEGTIDDLELDIGDTWVAFQIISANPYGISESGSGESLSWFGGGMTMGYIRPNTPITTCDTSYLNPPEFHWSEFSDPNMGDEQNAFQLQIDKWLGGTCGDFSSPVFNRTVFSAENNYIIPNPLDPLLFYCWRVRVRDDSTKRLWSDWSACDNGFQVNSNLRPTAVVVGGNKIMTVGDSANLDGSDSFDLVDTSGKPDIDDGAPDLTYLWTFESVPPSSSAFFSDDTNWRPSFTADEIGIYTIQLTVTDSDGAPDSLDVDLIYRADPPDDCGDGLWGPEECDATALGGDAPCPGKCIDAGLANECTCDVKWWNWWEDIPLF